ncbi:zinc finger CCHC-type and RNA-binding motif-containing protein 1-like [Mizuhopecten yessoensis]|uniref:Zinc finger CCHC-type and RNA-binding motif-containing protein 1 n=1 Tax=Mizuhopecten yessoensis TaxID=6573 RepID=A0A210QSD6_MIZYE|nr:zinc finger CCHC-type and RNA-binding motif-containing protein 1-like [Mizuhopecten yessoensis]XP_021350961.1 zinc finger CCHC-type and RNA-binding motif-containing protein 1-like [Mizuhopecten yessoensis]OWF51639.1 Zinc finger CCHC-type and RNA-binding motif-containing protein 1 [Mizuhopecten yessoensis]
MSGGLAPSKSTIYVSNLPFSLTNNDLHKIFEKYGKIAKVTIMSDRVTRRSKGVAFVLFVERDSAHKASHALNNTTMFGRTIRCNIAKDNGRTTEFIKRKDYPDKSRCYECGEEGHLSYKCPKNLLGERQPPPKKDKKKKKDQEEEGQGEEEENDDDEEDNMPDPALDSLAATINYQRQQMESEVARRYGETSLNFNDIDEPKRKKYKKDAYFSDEEEVDED